MIHLEKAEARRKCNDCKSSIERGEIAGVVNEEGNFGTKKVSYCKVCTIQGLEQRRNRINHMLRQMRHA